MQEITTPHVVEEVIQKAPKSLTEPLQAEQKQEKKLKKPKKKDTPTPQIENVPIETQPSFEELDDMKPSPIEAVTAEEIMEIVEDKNEPFEEKPKILHKHKKPKEKEVVIPQKVEDIIVEEPKDTNKLIDQEKQLQNKTKKYKKKEDSPLQVTEHVDEKLKLAEEPKETKETVTKKIKKAPQDKDDAPIEHTQPEEIPDHVTTKKSKLVPMKIERVAVKVSEAQHPAEVDGPQFTKLKLKKSTQKPKLEQTSVTLPKFQLKSRIRYINDWPPQEIKPIISYLGSVRQNGELSRNMKEAAKIKKKTVKVPIIPDLEKVELEKPEQFDFSPQKTDTSAYSEENPLEDFRSITEVSQPEKNKETPHKETAPEQISKKPKKEPKKPVEQHVPDDLPVEKPSSKLEEEPIQNLTQVKEEPFEPIPVEENEIVKVTEDKPMDEILEEQQQLKKPKKKSKPVKDKLTVADIINEDLGTQQKDRPDDIIEPFELPENVPETMEEVKEIRTETVEPKISDQTSLDAKVAENTVEEKPKKVKKIKKKDIPEKKLDEISTPDHPKEVVTEPEELVFEPDEVDKIPEEKSKKKKAIKPEKAISTEDEEKREVTRKDSVPTQKEEKKPKLKLVPIKIERKVLEMGQPQHAESVEGPQFTKLKLKKTATKPKSEAKSVTLPAFQLKSRIRYIKDWPPQIIKPLINFLGSVRQNGILSRNIKEAAKIKKKVYKQPELPDIERTELEKPTFGYEDIIEAKKQISEDQEIGDDVKDEEPEQVTLKPRRPSVKKTEEVEEEITIKKTLKPRRKPSVTLPEVTEPETVTFRPKSTKTKEDVEQEFNIHLDSYAEEEISLTSKVKLKPQRQPTFTEEADVASIKFYEEEEGPDVVEIVESDIEIEDDMANVMMPLKKTKKAKKLKREDITSSVTISKPKPIDDETSEITEDVSLKLERKPKYEVNDQEEVSFDIKPQTDQFTMEELSLSSKIKLKSKKKPTISEAADEASIKLTQEIEDDSQVEEVILSEAESEENIEMFIKRKPKKPAYEVSEIEELSVEFKPKKVYEDTYEEEQLTISAKRKPRKPSQLQGKKDNNFVSAN